MEREQFKNKVGFLLATLGGAIGIANLISFPPLLSNHGILFAVFYLLFTILIGIPLMSMEIAIGRNTSSNAIGAYSKLGGKKWKYLGILNIACCFVLFTIFMILLIWTFRYFTGFAMNNIPKDFGSYVSKDYKEIVILGGLLISLNVLVVGLGVQKGIERVSKILIPIFAIVLLAFAFWNFSDINSVVLNFKSVFTRFPTNISELGQLLSDALGQAFFSLSLGAGAMLTYGSYLSKKERIGNLANIIVQTDTIVAVICSLFILPLALNLKFSDTPLFIFVTISDYFNSLPYSNLIGSLFFLCLSFVVLTMTISVLEPVVSFLFDKHKKRRFLLALCVGFISLLCLIPLALSFGEEGSLTNLIPNGTTKGELGEIIPKYKSLFDLVFDIFINILLPIGGLLTCIFVIRIWKYKNFENEMALGNGKKWFAKYLKLSTLFIAPLLISILLVIKLTQFAFPSQVDMNEDKIDKLSHQEFLHYFFDNFMKYEPEECSSLGLHSKDSELKNWSPSSIMSETDFYTKTLSEIQRRLKSASNKEEIIDLEMLLINVEYRLHFFSKKGQLGNMWISKFPLSLISSQSLKANSKEDYFSISKRLKLIPTYLEIQEQNMLSGLKENIKPNSFVYNDVKSGIVNIIESNFFEKLVTSAKQFMSENEIEEFKNLCNHTVKVYSQHLNWLKKNIEQEAKSNKILNSNYEEYNYRIKNIFQINYSSEYLDSLAFYELKSIISKMEIVASSILHRKISGIDSLRTAVIEIRKTLSKNVCGLERNSVLTSVDSTCVINYYKEKHAEILSLVTKTNLFELNSEFKVKIDFMPEGASGKAPAANWPAQLLDCSSKGYFLIDMKRPLTIGVASALTIHEDVPGHYYQFLCWENKYGCGKVKYPVRFFNLEDENNVINGFWGMSINVEGYAHYVERLLEQNDFYTDNVEKLEALSAEALRAIRVIIDVELHSGKELFLKTSQGENIIQRAEAFLYLYGFEDKETAIESVEGRYALYPTQAMTYLVGALQIEELKTAWQKKYPSRSLKEFHKEFIDYGPVPVSIISKNMLVHYSNENHLK